MAPRVCAGGRFPFKGGIPARRHPKFRPFLIGGALTACLLAALLLPPRPKADPIVFFGDSITWEGDFASFFPEREIVNLGRPGDTIAAMIERVPQVQATHPNRIFLMCGINSLQNDNADACAAEYEMLLRALGRKVPDAKLYVLSVLPISRAWEDTICRAATIRAFNEALKALAGRHNAEYVDLYSLYEEGGRMNPQLTRDGLHLRPEAYGLWAEAIRDHIP